MTNHTADSLRQLLDRQLAEANARLDELHALPAGAAPETVARTYDAIGRALGDVHGFSELFMAVHPDKAVRSCAEEVSQAISTFSTALGLDREAYEAFARLDLPAGTDEGLARFVEHTLRDFRRSGVDQDEAGRAEIKALQEKLTLVGQAFDRNIMAGGRTLRLAEGHAALTGLPGDFLDAHPEDEDGSVTLSTDPRSTRPARSTPSATTCGGISSWSSTRAPTPRTRRSSRTCSRRGTSWRSSSDVRWAHWVCEDKMIRTADAAREFIESVAKRAR